MTAPRPTPQERRENPEPSEAYNPMPWVVIVATAALFLFGVFYILRSPDSGPPAWGDGRTPAELRGAPSTAAGPGGAADGAAIYAARCAACHQATGTGVPGVFPPLAGSEWVMGAETTLVAVVLHGVTGPLTVKGQSYSGAMPAFATQLNDAELAAVVSHLRGHWGNTAAPVTAQTVAAVREKSAARSTPYQGEAELKAAP